MDDANDKALRDGRYTAVTIEYPHNLLGQALGKNGLAHNSGLRIYVFEGTLRIQPIAKRASALMQGWIELPKHPLVLRQMQALIAQALFEIGEKPAAAVVDLGNGGID